MADYALASVGAMGNHGESRNLHQVGGVRSHVAGVIRMTWEHRRVALSHKSRELASHNAREVAAVICSHPSLCFVDCHEMVKFRDFVKDQLVCMLLNEPTRRTKAGESGAKRVQNDLTSAGRAIR